MPKENHEKGENSITKEKISRKLSNLKTTSEKIKYLQSIEPRIGVTKPQTQKAYYEALGDLSLKKEDFESAAEYYHKAGMKDKAKRIWEKLGDVEMTYRNSDSAIAHYNKANAKQKEEQILREREKRIWEKISLEKMLHLIVAFGSFFCSFIFLSGSITGNTILDASFKTSNLIGALLFIVGVVASFFYFEKRKKK